MKRALSSKARKGFAMCMAVLLCLTSLVPLLADLNFWTFAESPVWDGTTADSYAGGDGSEGNPYQIANGAQLAKLVQDPDTTGKYYELTADILLNDVSSENWTENESSLKKWFSGSQVFHGTFNGAGHTVSGLYINAQATSYWQGAGLFQGLGSGALVKNVGLTKASITFTGNGFAGGIAGYAFEEGAAEWVNPRIESCYGDGSVSVTGATTGGILGGSGNAFDIADCFFAGKVSGNEKETGGILGNSWAAYSLSRCYVVDNVVFGVKNTAAIEKYQALYTTKEGVWACTTVSRENMTGGSAKTNMPGFDWDNTWMTVENGLPIQRVFPRETPDDKEIWDGTTADSYAGGDGSEGNPYQIANGAQLAKLVQDPDTTGKYYELTADILLNDVSSENWTENESSLKKWFSGSQVFHGTFNGAGHTVSGLYINAQATSYWQGAGLFQGLGSGALVKNVGLTKASITFTGNGFAGGIAGYAFEEGAAEWVNPRIESCYGDGSVSVTGATTGGILGGSGNAFDIADCFFAGKVSGNEKETGGILGNSWAAYSLSRCYVVDNVVFGVKNTAAIEKYQALYTTKEGVWACTTVSRENMTGGSAKTNMPGFDWDNTWMTVENGLPIQRVFPRETPDGKGIWDGTTADSYAGGDGSEGNPYQIANGAQLAKLVQDADTAGKYYKLTADILLNDTLEDNWYESGTSKAWYSVNDDKAVRFQGHLEGVGHTVSGLYYGETEKKDGYRSGLFPMIGDGAVIRNVGITHSYMSGLGNVGAIAGWSHKIAENPVRPVITGCYADETVVLKGMRIGGIVAAGSLPVAVDNCFFAGAMEASENVKGGITAWFWGGTMSFVHCYSVDYPIRWTESSATYELRDCYSNVEQADVRVRTKAQMTGKDAKTNMPALEWDTIWTTAEGKTPRLKPVAADHQLGNNGTPGAVWSGQLAYEYAGGDGSKENPYQIATAEQMAKLVSDLVNAADVNSKDMYFELTHDILLNDTTAENWMDNAHSWFYSTWEQYEKHHGFRGHLNGNGHIVSGIYLNVDREGQVLAGLIPVIGESGVVENIGVTNSYIHGYDNKHSMGCVGALVGYCYDWPIPESHDGTGLLATIRGCFSDKTVTVAGNYVGGILGATPRAILIENCYATSVLETNSTGLKGCLTGNNWSGIIQSPLRNCYAANDAKDPAVGKCFDTTVSTNVYGTVFSLSQVRILSLKSMRGANAKQYMDGFDFDSVWYACEDGTPVLRAFGTTSKYSNKSPFDKVQITFVTNGGNEVEPIIGEEGEKIIWPTVARYGYKFAGWHVYKELDCEYPLDVFPMNDVTLYAEWEAVGIFQGFEQFDADMLLGDGFEHYHMGLGNYDVDKVYEGGKSIHWLDTSDSGKMVLFDKDNGQLTPGAEYDLTFWVYVDDDTAPQLMLLPMKRAKASADPAADGLALPALNGAKRGQWQQVSYRFVAQSQYLALAVAGGEAYFDDVAIVPTGKASEQPGKQPGSTATGDTTSAAVAVLLLLVSLAGVCFCYRRKQTV